MRLKHSYSDGCRRPEGRRFARGPDDVRRGRHGGGRPGRFFEHGDLRLVILALIAEKLSHGYEIIKTIDERVGGAYSPSPGVVYPSANRTTVAALFARIAEVGKAWIGAEMSPVLRGMENLKLTCALRSSASHERCEKFGMPSTLRAHSISASQRHSGFLASLM